MRLARRSRFATALLALISVLFMQLAAAAYACPTLPPPDTAHAAAMLVSSAEHEGMADCDTDNAQAALCYAQSQTGNQSLDKPAPPDVSPSAAVLLVPVIMDIGAAHRPILPAADTVSLMRAAAPPLAIRNCCFRI